MYQQRRAGIGHTQQERYPQGIGALDPRLLLSLGSALSQAGGLSELPHSTFERLGQAGGQFGGEMDTIMQRRFQERLAEKQEERASKQFDMEMKQAQTEMKRLEQQDKVAQQAADYLAKGGDREGITSILMQNPSTMGLGMSVMEMNDQQAYRQQQMGLAQQGMNLDRQQADRQNSLAERGLSLEQQQANRQYGLGQSELGLRQQELGMRGQELEKEYQLALQEMAQGNRAPRPLRDDEGNLIGHYGGGQSSYMPQSGLGMFGEEDIGGIVPEMVQGDGPPPTPEAAAKQSQAATAQEKARSELTGLKKSIAADQWNKTLTPQKIAEYEKEVRSRYSADPETSAQLIDELVRMREGVAREPIRTPGEAVQRITPAPVKRGLGQAWDWLTEPRP